MTDAKFTPGPWRVGDRLDKCIDIEKDMGYGEVACLVAEVNTDGFYVTDPIEQDANAHLIAGAPEMYEAISTFLTAHENVKQVCQTPVFARSEAEAVDTAFDAQQAAIRGLYAALTKARGEATDANS